MITKSDWEAVRQRMSDEDLRNLGEPPTAEEVLAYGRQELSEQDAERVRAWLVCNPELARALVQPFPDDDVKPGEDGFLSQAELAEAWKSVQARVHGSEVRADSTTRRLKFPERWIGLAAAVAIGFAGLFAQAESEARRLGRQLNAPRVLQAVQQHQLEPDSGRRGAPTDSSPIQVDGRDVLLDLPLSPASGLERYRVKIADARTVPARWLWDSPITAAEDGSIAVLIPSAYLKPGKYRIVVYSVKDGREEALDSYTVPVVVR